MGKIPVEKQTKPYIKHRKQMRWQVWFPLSIAVGLVLAGLGLSVYKIAGGGDVNNWANLSLIICLPLVMLFVLLSIAVFGAAGYGLIRANEELPPLFYRTQHRLGIIGTHANTLAMKFVNMMIFMKSLSASLKRFLQKMTRK